ncbi:MAG: ATP-dependent RecD-like DNA helicase [Candidatus Hydrogenedentes bacterium]|nr:ATP-dependent RecD-like DNA helicase [Candidatus Hydrogenedentota bacterium]
MDGEGLELFPQPVSPPDPTLICVEGVVDRIVYENPANGFFVGRLQQPGTPDPITFVGNLLAVSPGETVRLWGRWVEDRRFGRQFRIQRYETLMPQTKDAIERYLGSGLIEGIGSVFAKRLVDAFGVETLKVIDEHPEHLRKVPGIGKGRAAQIREAWSAQKAVQSIMLFLQGHGIGVNQAVKIYRKYGDAAAAVLRENPYRLAEDITGIAFKSADTIAMQFGIAKNAPQRLEAGLRFVLEEAAGNGHVFLRESELTSEAARLLEVDTRALANPLNALAARKSVVREGDAFYLHALHTAEAGAAQCLRELLGAAHDLVPIDVERAVQWVERTQDIRLSEDQRQAIRTAVGSKVMVITGGPGTGKTTIIKSLLAIFEKKNFGVLLAAPTGRAAKRMEEATGHEAKTIHRLLEYSPKQGGFLCNAENPLKTDLVIIDETSMVDIYLMYSLVRAVPPHARLFFVGDVDQLPSVGPGSALMDIIASEAVPVVWLKTVFRQAAESGIVANAHRINRGEYPEFNTRDFFFIERKDSSQALETVVELVTSRIPKKFGFTPVQAIQVLAPMHRGEVGVSRLNEVLQQALNPNGELIQRREFRLGDKVMQLRNNYELDVYNGDVGIITVADAEAKELQVQFDDRAVIYAFDQLDDLALAYAATVHKSQGSEYPAVVIPLLPQHFLLLQRNVLYTAITRASRLVILVGDPKAIRMAVRNTKVTHRNSRLAERLRVCPVQAKPAPSL